MEFRFKHNKEEMKIDAEVCDNAFSQGRGLMFRRKSKPLLFVFKSAKRRAIHSFFCKQFYAIWFNKGKIIDEKSVNPWKISVIPKEEFDTLLEIPVSSDCFKKFVDEDRNI
jgi:uncharacterized membrane protein (UPF0127 family)